VTGYSYSWSIPNATFSGQGTHSVSASWATAGTRTVQVIISSQGCSATLSKTVTVNNKFTIAGGIYSELNTPVPAVSINLTGSETGIKVTASDGLYNFDVSPAGNYKIKPSKSNDVVANNGISTFDIILVQRHILAIQSLGSAYKVIAADVNGSGTVSTLDIVLMRTVILGNSNTFPEGRLWEFVRKDFIFSNPLNPFASQWPDSITYNNVSAPHTSQDFIGIKLGDVNNNWDPNIAKMSSAGEITLMMKDRSARRQEIASVPVMVKDFTEVSGYQFTLSWDASILEYKGIEECELTCYLGDHSVEDGKVSILWTDEMGGSVSLPDSSVLFHILFKPAGEPGDESSIQITSDITPIEAVNSNLQLLNIAANECKVKIMDENQQENMEVEVFPNPTSGMITIKANSLSAEQGKLKVYDTVGKLMLSRSVPAESLEHGVTMDLPNTGGNIFFLRVISGKHAKEIKVLKTD